MRRSMLVLILGAGMLGVPAVAAAQDPAPVAASATAEAPPPAAQGRFEVSEGLETLRYQNLWIAYGVIWLFVFGFVLRNWKLERATDRELAALEARIGELEGAGEARNDG